MQQTLGVLYQKVAFQIQTIPVSVVTVSTAYGQTLLIYSVPHSASGKSVKMEWRLACGRAA
jgi:hypothetical protein